MTALFRSPGARSPKYTSQSQQAASVVQAQRQDVPLHKPVAIIDSPIPPAATTPPFRDRQAVSPPTPVPVATNPERPKPSLPKETTSSSDPTWNRLETIFRKHQEQEEGPSVSTPEGNPPVSEPAISPPDQASAQPSDQLHSDEAPLSEPAEMQDSEEPSPAIEGSTPTRPAMAPIQRSAEPAKSKTQPAIPNAGKKPPSRHSLPSQPESAPAAVIDKTQAGSSLPGAAPDITDQISAPDPLAQQALPLETVWNVQRREVTQPSLEEMKTRPALRPAREQGDVTAVEASQVPEQQITPPPTSFDEEEVHSTEIETLESLPTAGSMPEPSKPAEILAPSRPRPSQGKVLAPGTSIQRQAEKTQTAKEMSELAPVNTPIGPLPADLWWLLGEKPPSGGPQPEQGQAGAETRIQRQESSGDQNPPSRPGTPAPEEKPVHTTPRPDLIQRQAVSTIPSTSLPMEQKRTPQTGLEEDQVDFDDLARRVYAEIRNRLSIEWERMFRK